MAQPAFLVPDWRTDRQAEQRGAGDAERAHRPSHTRPDEGWVRAAATVQVARRRNRNCAHNCTPATPALQPVRQPRQIDRHARWLPGLLQPRAAPVAADALWRAGWPSPRLPASTARGCFHASTQPQQLPSAILFARWPVAIDVYQPVAERTRLDAAASGLARRLVRSRARRYRWRLAGVGPGGERRWLPRFKW